MKKRLVGISFFLVCFVFLFSAKVFAAPPVSNKMQLGEITPLLPAQEMRSYFQKMDQVYQEYFGPPFSNINLKIAANLNTKDGGDGFSDTLQTLEYGFMTKNYNQMKKTDPTEAWRKLQSSMRHELSHGRYYWGNTLVNYDRQWINEGWAKLFETLLEQKLEKDMGTIGNSSYFSYYIDKDTVAGTSAWGNRKIRMNHSLVYNMTTITHFLLAAAGSSSNKVFDFPKKYNAALYDYAVKNNLHRLSEGDVKKILDSLLPDTKVDGVRASDWYFQSPASFSKGTLGYHVGVTTDNQDITAFVFNRKYETNEKSPAFSDYFDVAAPNVSVKIEVVDPDGKVVASGTAITNQDGEASITKPKLDEYMYYTFKASANLQGRAIKGESYFYDVPPRPTMLSGIITDEAGKAVDKRYVGLLTSSNDFMYKNNGMFVMDIPEDQRTVSLNFLGYPQEITKGSFARIFFMKVPQSYLDAAAKLSAADLAKGLTGQQNIPHAGQDNNAPRTAMNVQAPSSEEVITVIIGILTLLFVSAASYLLAKGKLSRLRVLASGVISGALVFYAFNFVPRNMGILESRSPLRKIADYSLNFIIFFIAIYLLITVLTFTYKKIFSRDRN